MFIVFILTVKCSAFLKRRGMTFRVYSAIVRIKNVTKNLKIFLNRKNIDTSIIKVYFLKKNYEVKKNRLRYINISLHCILH